MRSGFSAVAPHERYAGNRPAGRISQARPHFGRSRRSLFKTYESVVVGIERSETQEACRLGGNVPGFAPLNPCHDIRELIRAATSPENMTWSLR